MPFKEHKASIFSQMNKNNQVKKPHSHKKVIKSKKQKYKLHHSFQVRTSKQQSENQNIPPQNDESLQKSNTQLVIGNLKSKKENFISSSGLIKCVQLLHISQEEIYSKLEENNFPILRFSLGELVKFSAQIMHKNEFSSKKIPFNLLLKAIGKIQSGYLHIPYHNFSHAFSLMQLFNLCVKKSPKLEAILSSEDHFYACLAGLAHDLGHKGTNNSFEVKKKSKLAQEHQNEAVLEKMHIQKFFALMERSDETNLLKFSSNVPKTKKFITDLILATDMTRHFPDLKRLQQLKLQKPDLSSASVSKMDNQFIIEQVFHACDLGNSTQNFYNYIEWAALLSIKFSKQYKLEQEMGVEVSKGMKSENLIDLYNDQLWFVGNMVLPLWKQICSMEVAPVQLVLNLNKNLERVKQCKQEECRLQKS